MRAPAFWRQDGMLPRLLAPLGALTAAATARRLARPGWRAPVPVLCIGNATAGGAGKTTLALDLGARLVARGRRVAFIGHGYGMAGGRPRTPHRVDPAADTAARVGDEARLLAAIAPSWLARDRAAAARAAIAAGAEMLIQDDGLQDPALRPSLALLAIDGVSGFGNRRCLPAGPLRESVAAAAARCQAAVLIGADEAGALAALPPGLPVLRAHLVATERLDGRRVLAFAGIARPEKFRATLVAAGAEVVALVAFPDHHRFTAREIAAVLAQAARLGAEPVTTPKDAARLPAGTTPHIVGVRLVWADEGALEALLDRFERGDGR